MNQEKKAPAAAAPAATAQVATEAESDEQKKKNTRARRLSYVTGDQSGQPNLVGACMSSKALSRGGWINPEHVVFALSGAKCRTCQA